jgi:hypothetical protein
MSDARAADTEATTDPTAAARDLLDAARAKEGVDAALAALAGLDEEPLAPLREDRRTALAFWLNVYNAATQVLLARAPERYESAFRVVRFFGADVVTVGNEALSLDDIEHGILRGSRAKYGAGYLPRLADAFERRYRLATPDPRVHFALNCGAASCPAVRYYEASKVDDQLDLAAETYLQGQVEYDADAETARLPRVFLWYHGDFDDPIGLCKRYGALPADAAPTVRYRSWDWTQERKFA